MSDLQLIKILPNTADQRTKERIKQHGPLFNVLQRGNPICFFGEEAVLLESVKSSWTGWIPTSHIAIN